jgi:cytochrome c oxidase assembly protein subunit 15
MTFLVLVVGGITRLTHSGLSIVDWRPLVGVIPPLTESDWIESFARYQQFPEYRQLRPEMTLAEYKGIFFWEYLHRLLARLIGLVFLVPFAFFYASGSLTRPMTQRTLALFALGSLQGLAGWLMVQSGLVDRPSVSHYRLAIHLVLAFSIIGFCVWLIRDVSAATTRECVPLPAKRGAVRAVFAVGALLGLQIVWGAFVAGLKAGYGFNTFPLMGGALLPIEHWPLRPALLNLVQHPWGVQWMHRLLGTLLLLAACGLHVRVRQNMDRTSRRFSVALLSAVAAQYALGVLTLVYVMPIGLALAHQAMAVAIVGLWVCLVHHLRRAAA